MLTKSAQKESWQAIFAGVKNEMAIPPMAASARRTISRQNRRPNQPVRSNIEALPAISFDLAGVVTLNESFATGGTIFSQGDIAETLMYIQRGRVKLSVASKADKVAIVAILGPGDFLGEACLGSQNIRMRTATAMAPTALLLLAGKGNQRKLHRFAGISQEILATMIGATRAHVNFFMNKFRKLGFIKYYGPLDANGGIHINSSLLAKALRK